MSRNTIEHLLFLIDNAFEGVGDSRTDGYHSLLTNLASVTEDDWHWVPPDGKRSIAAIVDHVGWSKYMYQNHSFGDASMTHETVPAAGSSDGPPTMAAQIDRLKDGHARLRVSVAALTDERLLEPSRTNWGEMKDIRWIIATLIEHDLYHAGEINHIRALHQKNDA
ncbi:MAG: DinB family protein [Chloroflexi bacterium]|nr:DinB family protein [Chloroflexota bacterium]